MKELMRFENDTALLHCVLSRDWGRVREVTLVMTAPRLQHVDMWHVHHSMDTLHYIQIQYTCTQTVFKWLLSDHQLIHEGSYDLIGHLQLVREQAIIAPSLTFMCPSSGIILSTRAANDPLVHNHGEGPIFTSTYYLLCLGVCLA